MGANVALLASLFATCITGAGRQAHDCAPFPLARNFRVDRPMGQVDPVLPVVIGSSPASELRSLEPIVRRIPYM